MAKRLWTPSEERIKNTNLYRFMNIINETYNQNFSEYEPFYQWSIENITESCAGLPLCSAARALTRASL